MTSRIRRARRALGCMLGAVLAIGQVRAGDDVATVEVQLQVERERPVVPQLAREAFLARSAISSVGLSPDGRRLAWLQSRDGLSEVWTQAAASDAEPQPLLADTDAASLAWSRDGRWLFVESARQLIALAAAGQGGSRVIAVLDARSRRSLLAVDPTRPAAVVLLEAPIPDSTSHTPWKLLRVDTDGAQQTLHEDSQQIVDVGFDREDVAALVRVDGDAHVVMRRDGTTWQPALRCADLARCELLGVGDDGDIRLLTDVGADRQRLALLGRAGGLTTVHDDPHGEADIAGVVLDAADGTPLLARYETTRVAIHPLTPATATPLAAIERQLPGRMLDIDIAHGRAGRWLVSERGDAVHGAHYHLFDPARGTRAPLLAEQPFEGRDGPAGRLPSEALARRIAFAWQASDGMRLHGFLSVPPGVDLAGAPLVARIHGGPFSRVRQGFDSEVQLLVNRGYIVFEPNYRGSIGHGRAYMRAANGDFGNGRVQQDIVEGVHWLHARGIGDPQRTGIIGASFGGYSSLLGMTFEPDLFRVAIAGVPATDFGWTVRDYSRSDAEMQAGIPIATSMRQLGVDPDDDRIIARLRAQSPVANARRVRGPILLFAAGQDERVAIRSVTHYAATLAAQGGDVSLFVDADAGHGIDDRLTAAAWHYLLEAMLHRHLGGAEPTPPDAALREHLQRNLRRVGRGLPDIDG